MSAMQSFLDQHKQIMRDTEKFLQYPWDDTNYYTNWLAQTHYYTSWTTRLLAYCAVKLPQEETPLHNRFLSHCAEELGHENLTMADLKRFGLKPTDFPEFSSTAAVYQTQFFWIDQVNPKSFFGYITFLEDLGAQYCTPATCLVNDSHSGRPSNFLRVHGEEDIDHIEKAFQQIENFDDTTIRLVQENAKLSYELYFAMLDECKIYQRSNSLPAVA